jgi:hypothetical protein
MHEIITNYINASNARDIDTLMSLFTPDAVVTDEGETIRGVDAIRVWRSRTMAEYSFTTELLSIAKEGNETVATCRISGTFDGSPIVLRSSFTLVDGKIAAMSIRD